MSKLFADLYKYKYSLFSVDDALFASCFQSISYFSDKCFSRPWDIFLHCTASFQRPLNWLTHLLEESCYLITPQEGRALHRPWAPILLLSSRFFPPHTVSKSKPMTQWDIMVKRMHEASRLSMSLQDKVHELDWRSPARWDTADSRRRRGRRCSSFPGLKLCVVDQANYSSRGHMWVIKLLKKKMKEPFINPMLGKFAYSRNNAIENNGVILMKKKWGNEIKRNYRLKQTGNKRWSN